MNYKISVTAKLLLAASVLMMFTFEGLTQCSSNCSTKAPPKKETVKKEKTSAQTDAQKSKEVKLPKLVDLGATQCNACKQLAPILDELKKEYDGVLQVEFIDVWQKENLKKAEKYKIQQIPTQVFLDPEDKELWRHVGFISKEDILKKWQELGYDLKPKEKEKTSGSKKDK